MAPEPFSVHEELIYEIWLLDTEARNGGLSQYFCNRGLSQWQRCVAAASSDAIPSFFPFAERVAAFLRINPDPYLAIVSGGRKAGRPCTMNIRPPSFVICVQQSRARSNNALSQRPQTGAAGGRHSWWQNPGHKTICGPGSGKLRRRRCATQPRVAAQRLPWDARPDSSYPEGVTRSGRNPFRVEDLLRYRPRVAAARQPWAVSHNAFGVALK